MAPDVTRRFFVTAYDDVPIRGGPMPASTPTSSVAGVPRSSWTGRLEIDLFNSRGWRVDAVEAVVRIDSVTLWCANRTLAVMDRERFGTWLINPDTVFAIDDVVWSLQGPDLCITIDNSISYVLTEASTAQLLGVI